MRIPSNHEDREYFYLDTMQKCLNTKEDRKGDYTTYRSYFLFGSAPEQPPAYFNKINPHLDQLTSFLYSAETTRFSIQLGASVNHLEHRKTPVLTQALNDEWLNSNADQVFSSALTWALVFNTTYIKLVVNNGIHPYMVEPSSMGVLREDVAYTDRQEAIVQTYYITKSDLQQITESKKEKYGIEDVETPISPMEVAKPITPIPPEDKLSKTNAQFKENRDYKAVRGAEMKILGVNNTTNIFNAGNTMVFNEEKISNQSALYNVTYNALPNVVQ